MNLNMKRSMKMRGGFMCQSPAATAVLCMTTGDPRSVIVPPPWRRNNTTTTKYTRLVESRRFGRSNTMQSIRSDHQDIDLERNRKPLRLKPSSLITPSDQVFQVVVMRVSLHCQGCAGKVKKHLSKMEGVTSFRIDLEIKRVTVMVVASGSTGEHIKGEKSRVLTLLMDLDFYFTLVGDLR